jgi:hypothetical protein
MIFSQIIFLSINIINKLYLIWLFWLKKIENCFESGLIHNHLKTIVKMGGQKKPIPLQVKLGVGYRGNLKKPKKPNR